MSVENENETAAMIIYKIQEKWMLKMYFRRWITAADINIKYKRRSLNFRKESLNQLQIGINFDSPAVAAHESKKLMKDRKAFNLKYGDVVYFKCFQSSEMYGNYKGVISGDGIASNKLECVRNITKNTNFSEKNETKTIISKYSQLLFQKSMFSVVNAKKYYFQKRLKQNTQNQTEQEKEELKRKAQEEIAENQNNYERLTGHNVVFGDEIQLIHLYSSCILTLNFAVLAKQHCCRELSLEEESNDSSNFRLLSLNFGKKQGEPILYSDQLILVNGLHPQWKLSVQDISDPYANICDGLEVNASEVPMALQICNFIDNQTQKDMITRQIQGKYIQSGDVITIKNRDSNGLMSIKKNKMFSEFLGRRDINFIDPETNIKKVMKQDYFIVQDLVFIDQIKSMYELYVDNTSTSNGNINALWEIQVLDSLQYECPTYRKTLTQYKKFLESVFLLKHVATGCFLMLDDENLALTYNGLLSECQFLLKSKKNLKDNIPYSESAKVLSQLQYLKIQSVVNSNLIIMCDKDVSLTQKQKKSNMAKTVFVLTQADQALAKTAQRICSLNLYLFQFYTFLQDWGIIYQEQADKKPILLYDYNKSFNSQKSLFDEIRQLFQSLDNLKSYITNDFQPQSNEEMKFRQNQARESGIINMLLCILTLIHFMIYGSTQNKQQYYQVPGQLKQPSKTIITVPDKSPQKIAKQKLDPYIQVNNKQSNNCIQEIYSILLTCIKGNYESCNQLMKLNLTESKNNSDSKVINFLLQQLPYQRIAVESLLKESVRYTTDVGSDQNQSSISDWIQQLESVTDTNIQDQCLYIEIISLIMIDPYENPIVTSQNLCRRLIFKSYKNIRVFDTSLLKFNLDQGIASLCFQSQYSTEDFKSYNKDFCQAYQTYCFKGSKNNQQIGKKDHQCQQFLIDFMNLPTMRQQVRPEEKKAKIPILNHYETYTLNVLNLFSSLCKGRNFKSIDCIRETGGINHQFLLSLIPKLKVHQLRYKTCLLNLYSTISIDSDPLLSIRLFSNKCYLQEDIATFDLSAASGKIFYDYSASQNMKETKVYEEFQKKYIGGQQERVNSQEDEQLGKQDAEMKEHEEQKHYAGFIIQREVNNSILKNCIDLLVQEEYPNQLILKSDTNISINYNLYAQYQLEFLLSLLKMINYSVDLGYNNLETNIKILHTLPNIFYAMVLIAQKIKNFSNVKDFEENLKDLKQQINRDPFIIKHKNFFRRNWLLDFLIWTMEMVDDQLLILKIYLESISILKTFYQLKKNLQTLKFLGFFKNNLMCKNRMVRSNSRFNESEMNEPVVELEDLNDQSYIEFMDIFDEGNLININALLFDNLFHQQGRTRLNDDLLEMLISNFNYYGSLCSEMNSIEIIGNAFELELFSIINGNNRKHQSICGPKQIQLDIKKTIKLISIKGAKIKEEGLQKSYDNVTQYLAGILDVFHTKLKGKSVFLGAFQNILRNARVHTLLISTIVDPKKITLKAEQVNIIGYYRSLIEFLVLFTKNNVVNQAEVFGSLSQILDLCLMSQSKADDIYYKCLKVNTLVIEIISQFRTDSNKIDDVVEMILEKIEKIGAQLRKMGKMFWDKSNPQLISGHSVNTDEIQLNDKIVSFNRQKVYKEIINLKAIMQYLRVLRSLTRTYDSPSSPLYHNKHLLLQRIIKSSILKFMILPQNFFPEIQHNYIAPSNQIQTSLNMQYNRIKLHAAAIRLLTECCHNYRLGIQETQRTLLYDEIKTIMLKPSCNYIIKRAYLMLVFEVYINRVVEDSQQNEVVENDEVADILSRIIIPDIDQKQVFKLLEGLVSLNNPNNRLLKTQIAKRKVFYFDKSKDSRPQSDQDDEDQSNQVRERGILKDTHEYWKYIRQDGVFYFLVCVYDELKDRVDLEQGDEQNLADEFSIIKNNIQKMKEIFKILEQDFRMKSDELNLEVYRDLIISIEEIIPQRKITKFGKNYAIGFGPNTQLMFQKFDTLNEDHGGDKKIQEQENVQVINNLFKRNMKIYLLRAQINVEDLLQYCESLKPESERSIKDIIPIVNQFKIYITEDELNTLEREDISKIKQERELKEQQPVHGKTVDTWELFKIAMRLHFQRKKIAKSFEEVHDEPWEEQENEQQEQLKLFNKFEQYIAKIAKLQHLKSVQRRDLFLNREDRELSDKEEEEENIDEYNKKDTSEINKIMQEPLNDQERKTLLADTQIELLMWQILEDRSIKPNSSFTEFLSRCTAIFIDKEIYVIKLCRILLEGSMPTTDQIELLGKATNSDKIKKRLDTFKQYQLTIAKSNLDLTALQMVSQEDVDEYTKIEAINFLVKILKYGNTEVQERILKHLQSNFALQNNFFTFLRQFLTSNVIESIQCTYECYLQESKQTNLIEDADKTQCTYDHHEKTQFEWLAQGILELLQVLCENVNENFQKYLSKQNEDDSYASNINIVNQVADFLSFFLEDNSLKLKEKNGIICQCIETLIEFCTGYPPNRRDICNNKRLFSLMNQKLINELQIQFKECDDILFFQACSSEEQTKEPAFIERNQNYMTFKSLVKLILAMTVGNSDTDSIAPLLSIINIKQLLKISNNIYDQRIIPKQNQILWDQSCDQTKNHENCPDGICIINRNFVTDEDNMLIETGFNIFIFFLYVEALANRPEIEVLKLFEFDQEREDDDYSEVLTQEEFKLVRKQAVQDNQKTSKSKIQPINTNERKNDYKLANDEDLDCEPKRSGTFLEKEKEQAERLERQDLRGFLKDQFDPSYYRFNRQDSFFKFFREFIGRVEIQKSDGSVQKVFFKKPFFTKYITDQIKANLIFSSNRDSDQDRVLSLLERLDFYYVQMIHNQRLTRSRLIGLGARNWRILKDISFLMCLVIVILFISEHDQLESQSNSLISTLNRIITYIQIFLNTFICIFSAIERQQKYQISILILIRYPISIRFESSQGDKRLIILKKEAGFSTDWFMSTYQRFVTFLGDEFCLEQVQESCIKKAILISIDQNNIYNVNYYITPIQKILILLITFLAFFNPGIYALLLLDIINRSEDLQNIIKSITLNKLNLIKFTFLGLVGLLLYGILGEAYLKEKYDEDNGAYASTFILAIMTTVNQGLRNGGGIGDAMTNVAPENSSLYWGKYFFELSFFIIFNVLFLQIIFGIILDTFGELRDERQALLKEVIDKCFICSLSRNDIDSKGNNGWYYHIYLEHNVYHMVYYLIYLKKKNINDCDSLEKYVKNLIAEKDTLFFPLNKCLQLEETLKQE